MGRLTSPTSPVKVFTGIFTCFGSRVAYRQFLRPVGMIALNAWPGRCSAQGGVEGRQPPQGKPAARAVGKSTDFPIPCMAKQKSVRLCRYIGTHSAKGVVNGNVEYRNQCRSTGEDMPRKPLDKSRCAHTSRRSRVAPFAIRLLPRGECHRRAGV